MLFGVDVMLHATGGGGWVVSGEAGLAGLVLGLFEFFVTVLAGSLVMFYFFIMSDDRIGRCGGMFWLVYNFSPLDPGKAK